MTTTAEVNEFNGRLAELVKQVQAGNEVLLTQERKPVAKIISTSEKKLLPARRFKFICSKAIGF